MTDHAASDEITEQTSNPHSASHAETGHAEDIEEQIRGYLFVFVALLVLTGLTVAVAYLDLPIIPALIIGLTIATVKGGLVAGYFMHLLSEKQVIYFFLAFTVVFALAMFVLMTSAKYVHRASVP